MLSWLASRPRRWRSGCSKWLEHLRLVQREPTLIAASPRPAVERAPSSASRSSAVRKRPLSLAMLKRPWLNAAPRVAAAIADQHRVPAIARRA